MDAGIKARWIFLCQMILFTSFGDSNASGIPSSCIIPHVKEGGNASVTCMFTENISVKKSDFQIDRYSSINDKQETLLACTWNIDTLDKPKCYQHPRITFDSVITNTFEIQILHVTSVDAGKYICYVLPSPNGISNSCNLTLEETTFISETYTTRYQLPRSSDIPMIDIPTSIQDSKEDGIMSASVIGVISGVNIALFILQGICFLVAFRYIKRRLRDGTAANDPKSNMKHTSDIIPKTDEEKANPCVQQEEDIHDEENKTVSCILTSKSERPPTDSGFLQYEENGTTVGEVMTDNSIDDSASETGELTDSEVSIYLEEDIHDEENKAVSCILTSKSEGQPTDSGFPQYEGKGTGQVEDISEHRLLSSTFEREHLIGSVIPLRKGKGTGQLEDISEYRLLSSTFERDHLIGSVIPLRKVEYIRNWRNKYSSCASKQ